MCYLSPHLQEQMFQIRLFLGSVGITHHEVHTPVKNKHFKGG